VDVLCRCDDCGTVFWRHFQHTRRTRIRYLLELGMMFFIFFVCPFLLLMVGLVVVFGFTWLEAIKGVVAIVLVGLALWFIFGLKRR